MTRHLNRRDVVERLAAALAAATWAAAPVAARSVEHVVEIARFRFSPARLTVRAGDIVTWVNRDIAPHTATADDESWDTGLLNKGERKSVVVVPGMAASYFCRFHPMMKSELLVV